MKNYSLKIFSGYLALWAIANVPWFVSIFYLTPTSLEQKITLATISFIFWIIGLIVSFILLYIPVTKVKGTIALLKSSSKIDDNKLLNSTTTALNLPFTGTVIYSVVCLFTYITIIMMWRFYSIGALSANSLLTGLLPGITACAIMVFGVFTIISAPVAELLTSETSSRNLSIKKSIGIRVKITGLIAIFAVGWCAWMGGMAYYSSINQMISEMKSSSVFRNKAFVKDIIKVEDITLEYLKNESDKLKFHNNDFAFIAARNGKILYTPAGKKVFVAQWEDINQNIREMIRSGKSGSLYENVDEKVISVSPINERFVLGTASFISDRMPGLNRDIWPWLIIFALPGFLVSTIIGLSLSGSILHSINSIFRSISNLGKGNLTIRSGAVSADETGALVMDVNHFMNELSVMIKSIRNVSDELASGSQQISNTASEISKGANDQAANIEEVTSSMEEISSSISQNSNNAKNTSDIAGKSSEIAKEGSNTVQETVNYLETIAEKITLIEDIAYQTNLLALNAAIEAARAGEHGKGFAVVAGEVRKLSEKTQSASKEIMELAKNSVTISGEAVNILNNIVEHIQKTANLVIDITTSSEEQDAGAQQINQGMDQLNSIAQQNASSSEELSASSEVLNSQAAGLKELMSKFKVE